MFHTKIALVVRDDLQSWQKLNVTAFLMSGIVGSAPEIVGEPYRDAADNVYLSLLGGGLPAGSALAAGRLLGDAGARSARCAAPGDGAGGRAVRGGTGQPHPALHARERAGHRAGWDGHKRTRGSKRHLAVDTLGHLLALHVTPASANDRAAVTALAEAVQDATGASVELAFVDQGYTGERPADAAQAHGIALEVVSLPEAKRGFVLLPRRWVVERSFAWMARCRRLARDYERLPEVLAGLHLVAFVILMLRRAADLALVHNSL
jgi:transposase